MLTTNADQINADLLSFFKGTAAGASAEEEVRLEHLMRAGLWKNVTLEV
jgi:hypothetical protein